MTSYKVISMCLQSEYQNVFIGVLFCMLPERKQQWRKRCIMLSLVIYEIPFVTGQTGGERFMHTTFSCIYRRKGPMWRLWVVGRTKERGILACRGSVRTTRLDGKGFLEDGGSFRLMKNYLTDEDFSFPFHKPTFLDFGTFRLGAFRRSLWPMICPNL